MPKEYYDKKQMADSRAERKSSSAPTKEDLVIYEQALKQAIKGKKNPKALILGATPELRDICIKHGCETLAVDWSGKNIQAMEMVMKYQKSPKNLCLVCDWLEMAEYLPTNYFDVVLGDISINNLSIAGHKKICQDLKKLLKQSGYCIWRNEVFRKDLEKLTIEDFQKAYNQKKTYWLVSWPFLSNSLQFRKIMYDEKERLWKGEKYFKIMDRLFAEKKIRHSKSDYQKYLNLRKHGWNVFHTVFYKDDFEKFVSKYFSVVWSRHPKQWKFSELIPIYLLRNEK